MELDNITIFIGLAINGIFTGLGAAIGNYIANRHIIERGESVIKKIKGNIKKK